MCFAGELITSDMQSSVFKDWSTRCLYIQTGSFSLKPACFYKKGKRVVSHKDIEHVHPILVCQ